MREYYRNLPKKRMGAGVILLNDSGQILIVKPSYKKYWSIPGGVVEKDESPMEAATREISEELGISIKVRKLLGIIYTFPNPKGENLQFIFYGGLLQKKQFKKIVLKDKEIKELKFINSTGPFRLLSNHLQKNIPRCLKNIKRNGHVYFEQEEKD